MNAQWDIIAPQGPHLQHNTSAPLEHGATRLSLSELISAQSVLQGKENIITHYDLKQNVSEALSI